MSEAAEWTEDDQAYADFVSDLACEISADEDTVGDVLGALIERGLFNADAARGWIFAQDALSKQDGDAS